MVRTDSAPMSDINFGILNSNPRRQYRHIIFLYSLHLVTKLVTEHSTEALTPTPKNPAGRGKSECVRCESCPETGGG